jgi:hypothetical protein
LFALLEVSRSHVLLAPASSTSEVEDMDAETKVWRQGTAFFFKGLHTLA